MGWQDVAPSNEVDAADWIRERLHPFAQDVGAVIPTGFEAYARIFHPAWQGSGDPSGTPLEVRWSEVAAATGRIVHPEMQFHAIARHSPSAGDAVATPIQEPRLGVLSERQVDRLVGLLSGHTATPDACWMCLWDGYGYLGLEAKLSITAWPIRKPAHLRLKPPHLRLDLLSSARSKGSKPFPERSRVGLPGRDYLVFTGAVAEARGWQDGPNLWWPVDRAWCVASEIDLPYTYVGGRAELIGQILASPALESVAATVADGISALSDTINR